MKILAGSFLLLTFFSLAMAQDFKQFRTFYQENLKKHGIVGSSLMLVRDGKVIDREFYGSANLEKNQPVDADTIYHWASITKTFTGIAIMQLRDRGLLKLDDPIVKYLPELGQVNNPYGDMSEITLRQLMSHSAGFQAPTWPWGGDKDWQPHEPARWEQLVAMMPYMQIQFKPGTKFSYSNPAIIYLGRVIEILSKDDYEVYIDKNILRPLEMHRTYFDATPYHLLKYRSASYWIENGNRSPARFDVDTGITVSNGGLNSPLTDMVKYLNFLLGTGDKNVYEGILKRSSLEEMWQPQIKVEPEEKNGENRKDWMGLSFFLEENYGQKFIGHSGNQNGFIAHIYLHPASNSAYVVNFNTNAIPSETNKTQDTRLLDREIKEYLFKNIFLQLKN
jgi:CubicO group peptidase (beta-lactamase class C family)